MTATERLNAAAPELLDTVMVLLEGIDQVFAERNIKWDIDMDHRRRQAFDAIEKAVGVRPTSSGEGGLPFYWRQLP
jgi:hypothetical protein